MLHKRLIQRIEHDTDPSWHVLLLDALSQLPKAHLNFLSQNPWLPGEEKIFNAFKLPLPETHYILYGESPYPRAASANGFAFWDADVNELWSEKGLSKKVNRATSLRNFMKMLLKITPQQEKKIQTLDELFGNFLDHGFLLLNFNLSLSALSKNQEAKAWRLFHESLLNALVKKEKKPTLVLLGKIAERVLTLPASRHFKIFVSEHPYNLSFIENPKVRDFFSPFDLLCATPDEGN